MWGPGKVLPVRTVVCVCGLWGNVSGAAGGGNSAANWGSPVRWEPTGNRGEPNEGSTVTG